MSPTESELRSALRSGEGDGVDADAVIAHARGVRHARRVRLGSIAGAVVVVAGIAAGVMTLRGGQTAPATSAHPGAAAAAAGCPAQPPHLMMPGGGGTDQFGGSGPLFAQPVDSLLACSYPPNSPLRSTRLTGADAHHVADSLNNTSAYRQTVYDCVAPPPPNSVLLLLAQGQPPVVVHVGCTMLDNMATNGTALRSNWDPPRSVLPLVQALVNGGGPSATTAPAPGRRYSHGPAPRPTK